MWCHLVAISFINNDYTACLVLLNNSSLMFPEYGRKEWIKNRELKSSYRRKKTDITKVVFPKKESFSRKNHFYSMVYLLNRKKNKNPSKANEIFENKWKMKINIRINTIKTNRIEVFTILTVLRFKLFADIFRK